MALALGGCVRMGRVFAPEQFASPERPVGALAEVTVASGWKQEAPGPYAPAPLDVAGERWIRPVELTDRGWVEVRALDPEATLEVWGRHDDFVPRDFRPLVARTGTLPGTPTTAVDPFPAGVLGPAPVRLGFGDLQTPWAPEPVSDGDLVLVRITAPGAPAEDYLFRAHAFGFLYRPGAGVLFPVPLPWFREQSDLATSPSLVASLTVHHRWRTRSPAVTFLGEQLGIVGCVGVGSTALERPGELTERARGAFDAAVAGGGLELFQLADAEVLVNVSSAFRQGGEASWTFAVGVDAVRLGFVAGKAVVRLTSDRDLAGPDAR